MKANYYKIYSTARKKENDEAMGVAKIIDNNLFIIYKNSSSLLEYIDNGNEYLELFEKTKCTKKEFKKAFDEAINFYKKLV